jgi:pyruvate/2-oxoglutarate dehydrogenase complex dihydrolipoamide acyltransferase (E2) component
MPIRLVMPSLGESVIEGTVTKWLVREGDAVLREQPMVSVATDKADTEVPAPQSGTIVKILAPEGAIVKVGEPLGEIEAGSVAAKAPSSKGEQRPASVPSGDADNGPLRAARSSPGVRKLALERGVDLERVEGSGARGRVTPEDVLKAAGTPSEDVVKPAGAPAPPASSPALAGATDELSALLKTGVRFPAPNVGYGSYRVPPYRPTEGDQVVPFNRRRRLTADHMAYSKLTAPHVVTVAEVDLYKTSKLREANKERYKGEGAPLTMLAFVSAATVRALREFPALNARVLDDAYALLKDINLGIAVDAPDGLVVPNVKRADELSLKGLARAIDELAARAKAGKINADDLAGGTFCVSNPGIRGNLFGGAIIAQPNAGILRMGEIQKRVVVVEVDGQDTMAIHPVMYLALSYDHRIIDGVLGNSFLHRVTELLETGEFEV